MKRAWYKWLCRRSQRKRLTWERFTDLLRDYFESHGYELIEEYLPHDYVNWYFRPKIEG